MSCDKKDDPAPDSDPTTPIKCSDVTQTLTKNNTNFGFDLFKEINDLEAADKNLFVSPLSISTALAMTYNGAEGQTRTEMQETLSLENQTRDESNEGYKCLLEYLESLDEDVIMEIANSIWYKKGFAVKPEFLEVNQNYFDGEVQEINFAQPEAVDIINGWVSDNTNEKITEILDVIPANAVMYLINAIYFKGTWKYEFDSELTQDQSFYKADGTNVTRPFMKQQEEFDYFQNDDFAAIDLPYGDDKYNMTVFLPNFGESVDDIVDNLNEDNWNDWMDSFEKTEVVVGLPKFKLDYKIKLNETLQNMGMQRAFTDADFSSIADANLAISRVLHKTFVDVNEVGTEAAAVTVVEIFETSAGPPVPPNFTANRPFFFVIRDKVENNIVFMGKIMDPVVE